MADRKYRIQGHWLNKEIEKLFKEAWSSLGFFILQSLTNWSREGQVEEMKENFLYFCIDLCVKMCELMNNEYPSIDCSQIAFRFEAYVEKKMKDIFKNHLQNAMRSKHRNKIKNKD